MSQRIGAIDFTGDVARGIIVEATLRTAEIASTCLVQRSEDEDDASFLSRLRDEMSGHFDSLAITGDATRISSRVLNFPFGDLRKVEAAVGFELESQIPGSIDDVALSWTVTERSSNSARVLAATTPKATLLAQLEAFKDARLEPRVMTSAAGALIELLPADVSGEVGVLCLGEGESHLALVGDGELQFARSIRTGLTSVMATVTQTCGVDREEAHRLVTQVGFDRHTGPDLKLSEGLERGIKPIVSGVFTTLKAVEGGAVPKRIYLTGTLSRVPGLAEYLSGALGCEVEVLDLRQALAELNPNGVAVGPEFAPAASILLGLVRRGSSVPLNFRRGDLAYQGDLRLYRGLLVHLAIGLSICLLLGLGNLFVRYGLVKSDEEALNQEFCNVTKKVVGREICDPTAALATLRQAPGAGEEVVIPEYSAAQLYGSISELIGPDVDVSFDELEFRLASRGGEFDKVTGRGEAASFETTEQIVAVLKKDPCVGKAETSRQRKTRNTGRVEFHLAVDLRCKPGGAGDATTAAKQ